VKEAIQKQYNIIVKVLEPIYSISKDWEWLVIYPFLEWYKPLNTIIKEEIKFNNQSNKLFLFPPHNINKEKKQLINSLDEIYNHLDEYTQKNVHDIFHTRNILLKKENNSIYLYLTDPYLWNNISTEDLYKKFL
jgi:hypothetical protein